MLQQDALDTEELQALRLQKLQAQLQAVEGALAERREQLQQAAASAAEAREQERLGEFPSITGPVSHQGRAGGIKHGGLRLALSLS